MIVKTIIFPFAVAVVSSEYLDHSFCNEKLIKEVRAAKRANISVSALSSNAMQQPVGDDCKTRCYLQLSGKDFTNYEYHGEYSAPEWTQCKNTQQNWCVKGKCVSKNFCRVMMEKDIKEMMEKKDMYPLVRGVFSQDDKPCEMRCNMTADGKTVTKTFQAPDYAFCGNEDDGLPNICKTGKCLTPDGKKPKRPSFTGPF